MKKLFLYLMTTVLVIGIQAQTYIDPVDNTDLESNTTYIINPGVYSVADPGNDGILRIDNKENIIIDATGVSVDGSDYTGYFIKINNSSNILIRNFELIEQYYYAVYITNSDIIEVHDCNFNYNKVDSTGWISIWTNYTSALGGGVMMYQVNQGLIHDNMMKFQNDGVALYHCDNIDIWDNDFSWNTSFGIRMYFSDTCHIHFNNCSHVNRPFTNPSDCAALLVLVSNANLVEHNDLSYSGDGVFLGQFEYSNIPNNNIFRYNECSYSPHNAIEATFADGNVFYGNKCNYSHYGLWLGYSYNSLVDSNEVIGNQYSGIAIDRGFNNTIVKNIISENPNGIELWEGDGIPPYQNQYSHDYFIRQNLFEGNSEAIYAHNTEHLVLKDNIFKYNNNGVRLSGDASQDTILGNAFTTSCFYHIENGSTDDITATGNSFGFTDEDIIECNIWDKSDNPALGEVIWHPYIPVPDPVVLTDYIEDMAEEPARWYAYPEACWGYDSSFAAYTEWDYTDYVVGEASIHHQTGNGWDVGLHYWPEGDTVRMWSLSLADTLTFWLKTSNNTTYGFQFHHIRVGNNCGGYFKYTGSSSPLNAANGQWKLIKVPLAGGGSPYSYSKSQIGEVSLDEINYVSVHADTWDFGFEIWLDGVHFTSFGTGEQEIDPPQEISIQIYPNPAQEYIKLDLPVQAKVQVFDISGRELIELTSNSDIRKIDVSGLEDGIYYVRVTYEGQTISRSFVKR
ncbi:MAG: right-handed parallel beta-helix repeat-containing protein [Bacteroidales bacterium]|nr:right-handed parallel beta-helix repeat-containing protein [Bacteroidales bacterium]